VTLNLLQPGTYYAKVFGASGAQNPNYSITISPPAAPASAPVTVFPDVAYYGGTQDWALNSINAPEAWAQGYTGQGVIVAVVDTGVDFNHPELNSQIYVNPGEIAGNGIDDDHNGYVDDTSGWDFYSNDNYADDGNGHGTHVAGIIAAAANGFGVTGVAPGAKIMPVRVLGSDGSGSSNSVAAGIRYAVDNGADIINMSLGGSLSTVIQSAIQYAQQHNVLVVSAAGNDSGAMPTYPARLSASLSNLISVGAYNSSNVHASFSDLVGASGAVQVDAPGVAIYSTYLNGQYATLSGTSMATPEVSGLAALTLSANPSLTAAQLRNLIVAGANRAISGSDSVGGVNAAITVALAASGQTTASAASADPNAQLAAARTALANWFASLATELQSQATGQQGRSLGESLSLVSGASRGWRTSAIDQVMRAWG
jgi:subtilisin family serine protease